MASFTSVELIVIFFFLYAWLWYTWYSLWSTAFDIGKHSRYAANMLFLHENVSLPTDVAEFSRWYKT